MSQPESIFRKRLRKFRRLKRGYYSFLLITGAYLLSFALPLIANNKALVVHYNGGYYFPIARYHAATEFGVSAIGEPDYRALKKQFASDGGSNWVLMPIYPYGPNEALLDDSGTPPNPPSASHLMGTDDRGRDVLVRLAYGFNISLTFAIVVAIVGEGLGIAIGAMLGYFGGKLDIFGQRAIEIWSAVRSTSRPASRVSTGRARSARLEVGPSRSRASVRAGRRLMPRGTSQRRCVCRSGWGISKRGCG